MTPLPPPLGLGELVFWRLTQARFAATWDSGEGSYVAGGRWSSRGMRAVYASLDPATAILEVAVHVGFRTLDVVPHVLTAARIADFGWVHVVRPENVPDATWLEPGVVSAGQQAFGDRLLQMYPFVLMPSVVSGHSWNVLFNRSSTDARYEVAAQDRFKLDPRLHETT